MVYFIQGSITRRIKIGFTKGDSIIGRLSGIKTSCSEDITVLAIKSNGTIIDEHVIHGIFKNLREHGEWFKEDIELIRFIEEYTGVELDKKSFYKREISNQDSIRDTFNYNYYIKRKDKKFYHKRSW